MPTAVEYDPERESPTRESPTRESPTRESPTFAAGKAGLFLGGVFVMIIAVLIIIVCFGPKGLVLGMFKPMMSPGEQASLSCPSDTEPPDPDTIGIGDPGIKPLTDPPEPEKPPNPNNASMGDGSVSIAYQLVQGLNSVRVGMGGDNMTLYDLPCPGDSAPLPPPPVPATDEPTAAPDPGGGGSIVTQRFLPQPIVGTPPPGEVPACTPNPNDRVCSACENTDLDSVNCVCNMDGVCGPGEGLNCGDCMPTASGGDKPGGGGKKSTPCPAGAVCP